MSELLMVTRGTLSESLTFKKSLIRGDTIVSPYKTHEVRGGEGEGRKREEGKGEERVTCMYSTNSKYTCNSMCFLGCCYA